VYLKSLTKLAFHST